MGFKMKICDYFIFVSGLLYAEDGVRKLRLMESTTGIWTMRCTLIIDRRCLIINDKQTGVSRNFENFHFFACPLWP